MIEKNEDSRKLVIEIEKLYYVNKLNLNWDWAVEKIDKDNFDLF